MQDQNLAYSKYICDYVCDCVCLCASGAEIPGSAGVGSSSPTFQCGGQSTPTFSLGVQLISYSVIAALIRDLSVRS